MTSPIVIRHDNAYLNVKGRFTAELQQAKQFDTLEEAKEFLGMVNAGVPFVQCDFEYYGGAVAREDQEFAAQLQSMR